MDGWGVARVGCADSPSADGKATIGGKKSSKARGRGGGRGKRGTSRKRGVGRKRGTKKKRGAAKRRRGAAARRAAAAAERAGQESPSARPPEPQKVVVEVVQQPATQAAPQVVHVEPGPATEVHHYHTTREVIASPSGPAGAELEPVIGQVRSEWRSELQNMTAAQEAEALRTHSTMREMVMSASGQADSLALRLSQIELESKMRMDDEEAQLEATQRQVRDLQTELHKTHEAMQATQTAMVARVSRTKRLSWTLAVALFLLLLALAVLTYAYIT
ncbi:uncharacterized protein AMSG_07369 [Thecamonas trahens ATCC 50062]|uniref:Uncharacterized protein n=1 Tax=Thecamonas trahens ATCC 50062 TaxID=461836 RepID=A0A0L0DG98_THETB|nr:hypothetical protein AMSG_07369 [Thecamonas trahens ATCC 50062]KNC51354.1 hypothetical protein AMSG_07369 [Thecamonas trahens ATCC 50062]|eukprot:XP_013756274.1 hypothetical protein AMSG_07369 [Thecamonas trahens ATCC 50062]